MFAHSKMAPLIVLTLLLLLPPFKEQFIVPRTINLRPRISHCKIITKSVQMIFCKANCPGPINYYTCINLCARWPLKKFVEVVFDPHSRSPFPHNSLRWSWCSSKTPGIRLELRANIAVFAHNHRRTSEKKTARGGVKLGGGTSTPRTLCCCLLLRLLLHIMVAGAAGRFLLL